MPQNACTTGTTLPLDWVTNVGYSPFDWSFDGGLPLNRNEWEWPPTTKSTSSTSFAIFLSTSYPEWPTAITILTPWSAKLWEFYDYDSLYMNHLKRGIPILLNLIYANIYLWVLWLRFELMLLHPEMSHFQGWIFPKFNRKLSKQLLLLQIRRLMSLIWVFMSKSKESLLFVKRFVRSPQILL